MTVALKCPECGTPFQPRRYDQQFCSVKCSKAHDNRGLKRSARLYRDLVAWRTARNVKDPKAKERAKRAFAFICREVDDWAKEDRQAGRAVAVPNQWSSRGHERRSA